jgi:hypothetical protein
MDLCTVIVAACCFEFVHGTHTLLLTRFFIAETEVNNYETLSGIPSKFQTVTELQSKLFSLELQFQLQMGIFHIS